MDLEEEEATAGNIKKEFEDLYDKLGSSISSDPFHLVYDILEKEGFESKKDAAINLFKAELASVLKQKFNEMWETESIPVTLTALYAVKKEFNADTTTKWRPSGKTPDEQLRPLKVRLMEKKLAFFEKQFRFQKEDLENTIEKVENKRHILEENSNNQKSLLKEMEKQNEELRKIQNTLRTIRSKINNTE